MQKITTKYESYRYYIEGVKIDGEDYTAKNRCRCEKMARPITTTD